MTCYCTGAADLSPDVLTQLYTDTVQKPAVDVLVSVSVSQSAFDRHKQSRIMQTIPYAYAYVSYQYTSDSP